LFVGPVDGNSVGVTVGLFVGPFEGANVNFTGKETGGLVESLNVLGVWTGMGATEVALGTFTVQIHSFPTPLPVQLVVASVLGAQLADISLLSDGMEDAESPHPLPSLKRNCTFSPDLPV
jgi:hypothetical protein